jgi:hypothetical protein
VLKNEPFTWTIEAGYLSKEYVISIEHFTVFKSNTVLGPPYLPPHRGWCFSGSVEGDTCPPILIYGDEDLLDWRYDSEESLADYTIEVVYMKDGAENQSTYHVNRAFLANASSYFKRLFVSQRGQHFVELKDKVCTIELEPLAAKMFPNFLDYMYDNGRSGLKVCHPRQSVALYWLANYFGVPRLTVDLDHLFIGDLVPETCGEYLSAARDLDVQQIVDAVIDYCAKHLFSHEYQEWDGQEKWLGFRKGSYDSQWY